MTFDFRPNETETARILKMLDQEEMLMDQHRELLEKIRSALGRTGRRPARTAFKPASKGLSNKDFLSCFEG